MEFLVALLLQTAVLPHALDAGWQGEETCVLQQDNKTQRAFQCTFPSGVGHERHYHLPHIGYIIEGGTMRITDETGTRILETTAGKSWQSDGIAWHVAENIGDTTTSYLIVEPKTESVPRDKSLADATPEPSGAMPIPQVRGDSILSVLAQIYSGWPEGDEGKQSFDSTIEKNASGAYQAIIIQTGLLDDSVAQIRDTLTFANDGKWHVTFMKQERKCYRTSMFEWTTKLCP